MRMLRNAMEVAMEVDRGFKHRLFDPDTLDYDKAILRLNQRVEYRGELYLSFRDKKHYINVTK